MLDHDGKFSYSRIIRITGVPVIHTISVSPNPVINIAALKIKSDRDEIIQLALQDGNGKLISIKSFKLYKGNNHLTWNMQYILPGNYFISSANGRNGIINIIKQ